MTDSEFLKNTNAEYAAWCATYYRPESLDERGMLSLHGLWAWQEQERRIEQLREQVTLLRDAKPITLASGVTLNTTKGYIYCGVGDSFYRAWEQGK